MYMYSSMRMYTSMHILSLSLSLPPHPYLELAGLRARSVQLMVCVDYVLTCAHCVPKMRWSSVSLTSGHPDSPP